MTGTTIAEALRAAVEHHRSGRVAQASDLYSAILEIDADNFDALHLSGVAAHQRGQPALALIFLERALLSNPASADALSNAGRARTALGDLAGAEACFQKALLLRPDDFAAHNELGGALLAQGRVREAIAAYRSAVMLNPSVVGIRHNLGLAYGRDGDHAAALREFREAWAKDPMFFAAAEQYLSNAATLARSAGERTTFAGQPDPARRAGLGLGPSSSTTVIVCSIDEGKHTRVVDLYERLYKARPHEIVVIRDARSLAEAYNRAIANSTGDMIILSHDDIDIVADDFATRLHDHLQVHEVVGVMGSTNMTGPAWSWSGHPTLRGWISHHAPGDEDWALDIVNPSCSSGGIEVLDGVFLAGHRAAFEAIRFDEIHFDGFHLYDIDWSYRAAMAGFDMAVAGDLMLIHESRGRYDPAWERYAEHFCSKHGVGDVKPAPHRQVFEAKLTSKAQVKAVYEILANIDSMARGPTKAAAPPDHIE